MMPRGDVGVAGPQDGREHVGAVDRTPEVDAEHPLPVLKGEFADRGSAGADPGIVDHQRGCGAEPRLRLDGQILDIIELGDVASDCDGLATEFADCGDGSLGGDFVDVAADDPAAAAREFDRESGADSAAGTGHHSPRVVAHLG